MAVADMHNRVVEQLGLTSGARLSMGDGAAALVAYVSGIEQEIARLCSAYGHRFLLLALQSGMPECFLDPPPGFEGDIQELFNRTAVVAYKYAVPDETATVGMSHSDWEHLARTGDGACFETLNEIIPLWMGSFLLDGAHKAYRCVGKGSEVVFSLTESEDDVGGPQVITNDETAEMMTLFDNRLIRDMHLLGSAGFPAPIVFEGPLPLPFTAINFRGLRSSSSPAHPSAGMVSAYSSYLASLMRNPQITQRFAGRLHAEEFYCCHSAFLTQILDTVGSGRPLPGIGGFDIVPRWHLLGSAADHGPRLYVEVIEANKEVWPEGTDRPPVIQESFVPSYWIEIANTLVTASSYTRASAGTIDLWKVGHAPTHYLFELSDETYFVHLGLVQWAVQTLWEAYEHDGSEALLRGHTFEENVAGALVGAQWQQLWPLSRKMKCVVGSKRETDVDALLGRSDLGLLIQCKSQKRTAAQHRGDANACWSRWQDVQAWTRETHELAQFMAANPRDCDLPESIKYLIPIVCTGVPEYLWMPDETMFLPGMQPATKKTAAYRQSRVATISELFAYLNTLDDAGLDDLRTDPLTQTVRW